MHDTAYEIGRAFINAHRPAHRHHIVEIGSMNVNGSLRSHMNENGVYLGLDVDHGTDVDIVIDPDKPFPLRNDYADLLLSSSQMEHDPCFWETFLEFLRVTKDNGYIYINAPSNGIFHRYSLDCWRFYPDAGIALARWAKKNGFKCTLIESFTAHRRLDNWNDFVAVFQKCDAEDINNPTFISDEFSAENIHKFGTLTVINETILTEDMRLLQSLRQKTAEYSELQAINDSLGSENKNLRNILEETNVKMSEQVRNSEANYHSINQRFEQSIFDFDQLNLKNEALKIELEALKTTFSESNPDKS